jgi:hypothetical protein
VLSGEEFLSAIRLRDSDSALLFDRIINYINNNSQHSQIDGSGKIQPPPPVDSINVSAGDGMVHVTHTHNAVINKQVNYFTEWSVDGALTWHVAHHGASRELPIALPATNKTGTVAPYNYIFRGYAQYPGSDASEKTYFGGKANPTQVNVTGATKLDLLPAVGSGTGAPNGQQGGVGFGTAIERPALGPKRGNLNKS